MATAMQPADKPWYPLVVLRCLIGYAFFFFSNIGFMVLVVPFFLLLTPLPQIQKKTIRIIMHWYVVFLTRFWLPLLRVYTIHAEPALNRELPAPCILVANHRSRLDAQLLLSYFKNTGVVIKSSYTSIPVFAAFVKYLDFISIESTSVRSLETARARCSKLFEQKRNLLIFPEGTRAPSGRILPFKDLAFRLSMEFDIPIVPIAIHTELPFMARIKGSIFPPYQFKYTIRALNPCTTLKDETTGEFADRVQKLIAVEIKGLDRGTIWEQ